MILTFISAEPIVPRIFTAADPTSDLYKILENRKKPGYPWLMKHQINRTELRSTLDQKYRKKLLQVQVEQNVFVASVPIRKAPSVG